MRSIHFKDSVQAKKKDGILIMFTSRAPYRMNGRRREIQVDNDFRALRSIDAVTFDTRDCLH